VSQKPLVQLGDFSIVTDWGEEPVCVIQSTNVRVLPFEQIDAQFAFDYTVVSLPLPRCRKDRTRTANLRRKLVTA
jgi:hypothetical protein